MGLSRFDDVLKTVLGFEGGYSNDSNDRGGETNLGITAGTLARAHKAGIVGHADVKKLTRAEAARTYEAFYWKASRCDLLPEPLDLMVFDAAVNHGVGGAGRLLQRALNTMGADLAKARKALMTLAKSRRVRLHLCRRDEGLPCSVEDPFLTQSPMDSDGSARVDGRKPGFFKQGG